jgi:hypothetical protein
MNRRPEPGRLFVAALFVAAAAFLTSACGATSSASPPSSAASVRFENSFLAFRHPASWKTYPFRWTGGLHFRPMLYVSTQPVRDPCRTHGTAFECGWPVGRLQPDGILIVWENRGFPGWSLRTAEGTPLRVGGRRAKRLVTRPGVCAAVGGDETVEVEIARAARANWTDFTAWSTPCWRRPSSSLPEPPERR